MKRKRRRRRIFYIIVFLMIVLIVRKITKSKKQNAEENEDSFPVSNVSSEVQTVEVHVQPKEINDWRLILVNYENELPDNFEVELANIDKIRKFDSRAIDELKQMMSQMKADGITNVWVQSAYRSVEKQENVFERKVKNYVEQGKTHEEAEQLVAQTINKPGTSEHNLGLAVDFNYVDYEFDETQGFKWLEANAENYGFVLRYQKEKEKITKVDYEPWHWRYVGKEHASKMNELDMCLEEYVEYLKK